MKGTFPFAVIQFPHNTAQSYLGGVYEACGETKKLL